MVAPSERATSPRRAGSTTRTSVPRRREAQKSAVSLPSGVCYHVGGGLAGARKLHTIHYRPGGSLRFGIGKAPAKVEVPAERAPLPRRRRSAARKPGAERACGGGAGSPRRSGRGPCAGATANEELGSLAEDAGDGCDGIRTPTGSEIAAAEFNAGCDLWFGGLLSPELAPRSTGQWYGGDETQSMPAQSATEDAHIWPLVYGVYVYPPEAFDPSGQEGAWQQLDPAAAPHTYGGQVEHGGSQPISCEWALCAGTGEERGDFGGVGPALSDKASGAKAGLAEACGVGVAFSGAVCCEMAPVSTGAARSEPEGEPSLEESDGSDGSCSAAERAECEERLFPESPEPFEEKQPSSEQQDGWVDWGSDGKEGRRWDTESELQGLEDRKKKPLEENLQGLEGRKEKPSEYLTVMVRNIPNKYTRQMLVDQLNREYQGEFDFLYLPIDFKHECNVGYAFVSFRSVEVCQRFISQFHGVDAKDCLPGFNSKKVVEVTRARSQGLAENVKRLRNSPVMSQLHDHPEWLPLLFAESGEPRPFPQSERPPASTRQWRRSRK